MTGATTTVVAADADAYCAALEDMFENQPAGTFSPGQIDSEFAAYAATIETAAQSAPADQAESLRELVDFVRDTALDPAAEGTMERAFGLIGAMLEIQSHAENECGLDVESALGSSGTIDAPPLRTDVSIDAGSIEAANSAVPAGFELEFEAVETTDDEYPTLAVAPIGWVQSDIFGYTWDPPEDSNFGFFTEFRVADGCDGICAPQDWTDIMDDLELGPFSLLTGEGTVVLDKALTNPTGRLVVYQEPDAFHPVVVIATRWSDSADRYFKCEAQLDDGDEALWMAMAAACEASVPLWIPVG